MLGAEGYNEGMDEKESVGPEQSTPVQAEIELYQGFRSTGLDEEQALRTTQAVRVQAGHNINETLEVHRREVNTRVDGVETNLTAKIDGVETRLNARIDGVHAELKSMRRELNFYRRGFIVLFTLLALIIALLTLIIAAGVVPRLEPLLWPDSTPAHSVQAPVDSELPETAVPPESDPPEPPPQ